jgi:hypothetical protein
VIDACQREGWTIAGVAPERRSLERVFRSLQREEFERDDLGEPVRAGAGETSE